MNKSLMLAAFAVLLFGVAFADVQGASVNVGTTGKYPGTTAESVVTEGGNVTNVDLNSNISTEKWAAFYGNVSGALLLQQGTTGSPVYTWTWDPATGGAVCVSTASAYTWASVAALAAGAGQTAVDTLWFGGATTDTDSATNTLVDTESFTLGGVAVANTDASLDNQSWKTGVVSDGATAAKDDIGFCVNINNGGTLAVGGTGDYQMMAATDPALAAFETYYFYAQLD